MSKYILYGVALVLILFLMINYFTRWINIDYSLIGIGALGYNLGYILSQIEGALRKK